jgi:Tol biopolymer transport system component
MLLPGGRVMRTQPGVYALLSVLLLAPACDSTPEPATGTLRVSVATSGGDLDLNGYTVRVDGVERIPIGINAAATIADLATGSHDVALSDVAPNCSLGGATPAAVVIRDGATTDLQFTVACVATGVRITTATTGIDVDSNYALAMDGVSVGVLGANGSVEITRVAAGSHTVTLSAVAGNCAVGGENPRSVTVAVGEIVPVAFAVTCDAVTGVIAVTAATSGLDLDPNGYQILVDNSASQAINSNGTIYFSGVTGGSHQVELQVAFVYPNCTVLGENPRTLAVTTGGATRDTVRTTFQVTCAALGSLSITAPTSGVDPDPNGYRADAVGRISASVDVPATGGTATIPGLPAGDYSVTLSGVTVNCDVAGPNPRTISVPSGGTAAVAFDVTCAQAAQLALALTVNGNTDIYTLKSNGAGLTRLTTDPAIDYGPAWSPDGSKIAFDSYRHGNPEIYVMKADGTSPTRLTTNLAVDASPTWSPDGAKIAFVSGRDANGDAEIYVMSADGTNPVRLTTDPADDYGPAWSPDGSKIAFWSTRDGNGEIYVMNPDGLNVTRLTTNTVDDIFPEWSPDGSQLVFSRLTGCDSYSGFCDYDLFVMNADGSGAAQLTSGSSDHAPAWSPDAGSIAFGANFCAPYYYYYYSYGCYYSYSAVYIVRTDGTRVVELLRDAFSPAWRR